MHKALSRVCPLSPYLRIQARNYCEFQEQKKKCKKLLHVARHFQRFSGCVFIFLPDSPLSNPTSLLHSKKQQFLYLTSRGLHYSAIRYDEKQGEPGIDTKGSVKVAAAASGRTSRASVRDDKRKIDFTKTYTERNFITPLRAMTEYILKPSDLEGLRKHLRRSPFVQNPSISVLLRRDVELKAMEVWGSQEALQRELKKKQEEAQKYRDSIFHVKKILKSYTKSTADEQDVKRREMVLRTSGRVVMTAVIINATNFALKLVAWIYTGSHSMFAEAIHSFADTCNQLLLGYGIQKSLQTPTQYHPYGYHNMSYVASLISGVGIFFFGTGLSVYHGITGIMNPEAIDSLLWGYVTLGGSLISEGGTLMIALTETRRGAKREGMSIREYILRGQDPSVNVVLLEDIAAVLGIGIAGTCMGLTSYTGLPIYDAAGSVIIGGVLGMVASFIIYTNSGALVGRSITETRLAQMNKELENDVMIRAIHDVKATDMGNYFVRYKAELDFDGRELTRSYLYSLDLEALLKELQELKSIEELESFMLKHGENIVDLLGAEIDRIETTLKQRHPEVRHVDLEVL